MFRAGPIVDGLGAMAVRKLIPPRFPGLCTPPQSRRAEVSDCHSLAILAQACQLVAQAASLFVAARRDEL